MALVTVQRSPSVAESPQCSNSDGEADEDDDIKNEKSECFFAGKGTALVLALKDIPQYAERRLSTDSTRSTNSTQSNNSDIQQHLQSMFNLLRREETLKMAVKLEAQRPNRTRYLVIASRCCFSTTPTAITNRKSKITRHNSAKTAALTTTTTTTVGGAPNTQRQLSVDSHKTLQQSQLTSNLDVETLNDKLRLSASTVLPNVTTTNNLITRQSIKCDPEKENASGDSKNTMGIEEFCLLGIDCNDRTTIGLVVPILADTTIHLDGDGGFSVSVYGKTHIFKPVSVQAMWSALQTLHKVSQKARENNFYPGGPSHDWLSHYESRIESEQSCLNEWNAMDSLESRRPPSPDAIRNKPTAKEETESVIKMKLKEIMMSVDLDEVTSKYIRVRLEEILDMDLGEYKSFIDAEMLIILGQMDAPTEIFEHVYLGSEWNASNLEELQKNGVRHILNVTREIDNFFPGMFDYFNVRVYDDEKTNLLKHWDNTYRYITRAKAEGSKVLVHCKMGVSRSASVVIAYAMKAYNWDFEQALQHVKERRSCIKPNKNFLNQLETYRGMLDAMKNKEKLQRSKSETNLKSTKDARLLPGSEPTPLIQALNQAKSKSAGDEAVGGVVGGIAGVEELIVGRSCQRAGASALKQRRIVRRSSSTSPKTPSAIVMKQQSQSLENLTPERSVADEPKNVRFPGSNGENYSVTQNQVRHIQKNNNNSTPTSVRTRVHDLEAYQDARRTFNLHLFRSSSHDSQEQQRDCSGDEVQIPNHAPGSPIWTASTKLITQTSNLAATKIQKNDLTSAVEGGAADVFSAQLDNVFAKEEEEKHHRRKTHSWTATSGPSGGIIMDSSLPAPACGNTIESATPPIMRIRGTRQRELPSRHASWGSGDNRCSLPSRNSSWGSYDTNRNASAIFEGQIHELNFTPMSNKTANNLNCNALQHVGGTVKRTKQKLVQCTALKKLCQENGETSNKSQSTLSTDTTTISAAPTETSQTLKRNSNLYRSASAAGTTRARYPLRCNSEELVNSTAAGSMLPIMRRSDGSRPFSKDLFSVSAPDEYTISDIQNKNTSADVENSVMLRMTANTMSTVEDQRISGNVQILKKNFEAKAVGVTAPVVTCTTSTTTNFQTSTRKSHQSLPSSPVAQHTEHVVTTTIVTTTIPTSTATTTMLPSSSAVNATQAASSTASSTSSSSSSCSTSSASSANEAYDRNVKGLVHKYQTTTTSSSTINTITAPDCTTAAIKAMRTTTDGTMSSSKTVCSSTSNFKQRPRSYYDHKSHQIKTHDYSDSRPPPVPAKSVASNPTDGNLAHQQQPHRRLTQHGKTHPLARLSLPKQSFNAAAYNTILFRMLRTITYSFDNNNYNSNNNNNL